MLPIVSHGGYNIIEMWHGPSGSLKDFSLGLVTRFLNYFTKKHNIKAVGVVGTLGDTGCAAIQNCLGRDNMRLVVLYPENGVSKLQRLSMTTVSSPNIRVFGCECDGDEFEHDIKKVFNDHQFASSHHLLWLNSTNIGRILSHVIFHVYIYLKFSPQVDKEVGLYLPTGGTGNATGACIAHEMGLPIKIITAVNENDGLYKCFKDGVAQQQHEVIKTHACAIDTVMITNLERLLYIISGGDGQLIKQLMQEYDKGQKIALPDKIRVNNFTRCVRVEQQAALEMAKTMWNRHQYMVCPHTSVAMAAAMIEREAGLYNEPSVCYSTATPAKFPEFVRSVDLYAPIPSHQLTEGLEERLENKRIMKQGENWEELLI